MTGKASGHGLPRRRLALGLAPLGLLLLLGACSSLPSGGRSGPPVEAAAPAWRVGSEWLYSDGYGLRVTRVDGPASAPVTTFQRTDDPSQWVTRRGFLRESSRSGTTERRLLFEDLPPGAGLLLSSRTPLTYRREYAADGETRAHATSWTVEGRERVVVPAGEFDCVILVMRTRSLTGDWTGYERWWFSPQAQNYVRLEYRYGPDEEGARVLTSYRLAR